MIALYKYIKEHDKSHIIAEIEDIIEYYGLSYTAKYGNGRYCHITELGGRQQLSDYNKIPYSNLRKDYNLDICKFDKNLMFFCLCKYSFNFQIRFNAIGNFNVSVGKRDFNSHTINDLCAFIDRIHEQSCAFTNLSFLDFDINSLSEEDFVYADPPYLITNAAYNEKSNLMNWDKSSEVSLYKFLDGLNLVGIRFALSNVTEHGGKKNEILLDWINKNSYRVHHLDYSYSNSNYHKKDRNSKSDEVLILNY